jgi:hypothetical protein
MPTRTPAYLAEQRRTQHFSPQRLAAALGYINLAKGARRILALERDGNAVDGLLDNIIIVLGLDDHVHALVAEDRRLFEEAWQRWVDEPEGATFVKTMNVGEAAGPFTRLRGHGNRGFIFG